MAIVRSTRHPELCVHDVGVRFRDGVAEVNDRKVLAALGAIPGVEVLKAPARGKSKTDEE